MDSVEKQILGLLPQGMERPRPFKELITLTGMNSRAIRATIYRLITIHWGRVPAARQWLFHHYQRRGTQNRPCSPHLTN